MPLVLPSQIRSAQHDKPLPPIASAPAIPRLSIPVVPVLPVKVVVKVRTPGRPNPDQTPLFTQLKKEFGVSSPSKAMPRPPQHAQPGRKEQGHVYVSGEIKIKFAVPHNPPLKPAAHADAEERPAVPAKRGNGAMRITIPSSSAGKPALAAEMQGTPPVPQDAPHLRQFQPAPQPKRSTSACTLMQNTSPLHALNSLFEQHRKSSAHWHNDTIQASSPDDVTPPAPPRTTLHQSHKKSPASSSDTSASRAVTEDLPDTAPPAPARPRNSTAQPPVRAAREAANVAPPAVPMRSVVQTCHRPGGGDSGATDTCIASILDSDLGTNVVHMRGTGGHWGGGLEAESPLPDAVTRSSPHSPHRYVRPSRVDGTASGSSRLSTKLTCGDSFDSVDLPLGEVLPAEGLVQPFAPHVQNAAKELRSIRAIHYAAQERSRSETPIRNAGVMPHSLTPGEHSRSVSPLHRGFIDAFKAHDQTSSGRARASLAPQSSGSGADHGQMALSETALASRTRLVNLDGARKSASFRCELDAALASERVISEWSLTTDSSRLPTPVGESGGLLFLPTRRTVATLNEQVAAPKREPWTQEGGVGGVKPMAPPKDLMTPRPAEARRGCLGCLPWKRRARGAEARIELLGDGRFGGRSGKSEIRASLVNWSRG